MRKRWGVFWVLVASLWGVLASAGPVPLAVPLAQAVPLPPPLPPIVPGQFVKVEGTQFVLADQPFRFVGANVNPIHGDTDRRSTEALFAALAHDGLPVARVWALGEGRPDASEWEVKYVLFRAGPERVIEETLLHLDRVLLEARRAQVRVILTLSNNWPDYGGVPMYLRWLGLPSDGMAKESFYTDERAHALFRAHVGRLLIRVNSLTGVRYSDDPTILAWELMNESTVDTPAGRQARLAWVREMAQFIKTFDPNHLVAAGLWGYAMRSERADFIAVHSLPGIDYVDSHLYLQNGQPGVSLTRLHDFLDDRAQLARFVVKKPLVIGEFGFRTDQGPQYRGLPRARWFAELLGRHFQNQGAGALAWIYEPFHGKPRDFGIYIDRPFTDDVRQVLRDFGGRVLRGEPFAANPRLSPQQGTEPLYPVEQVLYGSPRPLGQWQRAVTGSLHLAVPPPSFRVARFARLGVWDGKPAVHFYGAESGEVEFRFLSPPPALRPAALAEFELAARLSAEWPGAAAPADGSTLLRVELDGVPLAEQPVMTDDGRGMWYRFRSRDPQLLDKLLRGEHTLRLVVPAGPKANGLCLYGDARDPALPKSDYGPLRVTLRPTIPPASR